MNRRQFIRGISGSLSAASIGSGFFHGSYLNGQPQAPPNTQDTSPVVVYQPPAIKIGSERQLFVDDLLLDRLENVSRFVDQPNKIPQNPILVASEPWENNPARIHYLDVVYDEEEKTFKLWYNTFNNKTSQWQLCYALSQDGIHFTRPNLGLVNFDGSTKNNLVAVPASGISSTCVMKDTHDQDPQRRYKMSYMVPSGHGQNMAWSADGLHWNALEGGPVLAPVGDGGCSLHWDEADRRYVVYLRTDGRHAMAWSKVKGASLFPLRRVGRAESPNFQWWTDVSEIVTPDERDGPGTEFYYMTVLKYEGNYVGFLNVFHDYIPGDQHPLAGFNYTLDAQLAFSRDGRRWARVCDRQTFLEGSPGQWDEKRIYVESALVRGDEIWIYYRGSNIPHLKIDNFVDKVVDGRKMLGDALGLAILRLDGFVSLVAGDREGSLTTKPLHWQGGRQLWVNTDASRGSLQVEALTLFGEPIAGFTRESCQAISTNSVRAPVVWHGGRSSFADLPQPVRLRFIMRNAKLFSFRIVSA